ncbi:hypothetical protein [Roseateles asaccharophilus]|uniref:Uncharacterized protein n=1 Tax=Roseateles asaccharophilus TaxID=582607 RepID=A0ABU2A3J3_9BURK|nr:hypothetical protein [Roseateles asaccharophilus]MDR7331766.1 hypothetical protein [Roseateles asaccharophilus]
MTRAEKAKAEGMPLLLPPAGDAAYLVAHLFEVGPLGWAGMGEVPISHVDIQAWQANMGIELEAWEARALRRMSGAYVDQLAKSREPACVAPWAPETLPEDARAVVHNKVKSAFSALAQISTKTGRPRHHDRRHR